MATRTRHKRWIVISMVVFVLLTASPLAFLANKLEPLILGLPLFFWWCMFWPSMVFVAMVIYIAIEDYGLGEGGRDS